LRIFFTFINFAAPLQRQNRGVDRYDQQYGLHTWLQAARGTISSCRWPTPSGYERNEILAAAEALDTAYLSAFTDPMQADQAALTPVVTTDVWTSMGFEMKPRSATSRRSRIYPGSTPDDGSCHRGAVFMHCLPAHRGEEVSAEVLDGTQSVMVWDEAENETRIAKALMEYLLLGRINS
jgi:ornithine carbamoyltransferase